MGKRLGGKRIAVLAADGFEHVEVAVPRQALRAEGAEVDVVSLHRGRIRGMNVTSPSGTVRVDRIVDPADVGAYDGLLVPGGFVGPDFVRQSKRAREFVRAFDEAGKPIATLCHGPWVLASAGILRGRTLTAWPGIRDDVVHAGATWRDEPVVRDGNLVSSRGPQDFAQFVPAMIDLFARGPELAAPERAAPSTSSPPRDAPPRVAVAAARILPGPTLRLLVAIGAAVALGIAARRRRDRSTSRATSRSAGRANEPATPADDRLEPAI